MIDINNINKRLKEVQSSASGAHSISLFLKIGFGFVVFTMFMAATSGNDVDMSSFVVILIPLMLIGAFASNSSSKANKVYNDALKDILSEEVFRPQFQDYYFNIKEGISRDAIAYAKIISMGDLMYSNDLMRGTYHNVPFERCDIHTQTEHTDSKGRKSYSTLFKGQYYIFEFNKQNSSHIRVMNYGLSNSFDFLNKNVVKLENDLFNTLFSTQSDDPQDVYYVFTPHFMERFIKLNRLMDGRITMAIINGSMHLAINNGRDSFDTKAKALDEDYKKQLIRDINTIKFVIEELDLSNTLFKDNQE